MEDEENGRVGEQVKAMFSHVLPEGDSLPHSKAFTQLFQHVPGEYIRRGASDWGDGLHP